MNLRGQVVGVVRGANGALDFEPLPGAHVYVERASGPFGTTTNADGNFSLDGLAAGENLTVSFVGYDTAQVPVPASDEAGLVIPLEVHTFREFEVFSDEAPGASLAGLFGIAALVLAAILSDD